MAVTGTARIPALPPNSLSAVATHLQTQHGAQPAGSWRIQFRPFQCLRSARSSQDMQRHRCMMWHVTDSAWPNHVFVVFEDTSKPTRAGADAPAEAASATPGLRRWHAHVLSAEIHTLLRQSSLPGPLGSPAGTPGPGAWIQRGAQVLLDGFSFRVKLGAHSQMRRGALDAVGEQEECILSIGNVIVGSDRIAGGIVEIQYLPLTRLAPDSTLLGSILTMLLPPDIVHLLVPPSAPPMPLSLPTMALPTMISPTQLAEIVPASGTSSSASFTPGAPGFDPWEDEVSTDSIGWSGVEMRRRMAYVHLVMLRAEGLA